MDGLAGSVKRLINSMYAETSCVFLPMVKTMFFTSNRPGGIGKKDIYISKSRKIGWGTPVKLGPTINTPYDEEGVFMNLTERHFISVRRDTTEWADTIYL